MALAFHERLCLALFHQYLSQRLSRGGVDTSRVRLLPTGTADMALKPPFYSLYYCSEVPGPGLLACTVASYRAAPSTVFPTRGYRGVTLLTPQPGDARTWRRPNLVTPKAVNLLTSSLGGPLMGPTICLTLTLTLVNARGRVGTISLTVRLREVRFCSCRLTRLGFVHS